MLRHISPNNVQHWQADSQVGHVKCTVAETKKGTEDAGTQTRAEVYAMLANQVVGAKP